MNQHAKRIVITGAGSGLGRAIALQFARQGWRVAVTDVHAERANDTLNQVEQLGSSGFAMTCDVTDETSMRALAVRVDQQWQGLDALVNNAGVSAAGTVADTAMEDWHWLLDVNLMGVVRGCHIFAPLFQRQGSGHIVNIASFAGIAAAPGMAAYNVAKAGVISLSESLRAEMAPLGVEVSVVCPAFFVSNLGDSFRSPDPKLKDLMTDFMNRSRVTANDVANDIYRAVERPRFMVITHTDARWLHRLKRFSPELFFRALLKVARRVFNRHAADTQTSEPTGAKDQ